jgi:hypothetical protein
LHIGTRQCFHFTDAARLGWRSTPQNRVLDLLLQRPARPVVSRSHRQQKQAAPAAAGLPLLANLYFFAGVFVIQCKRPPNPLLDRGQIQGQEVVGAAGCQRWGSRQAMSACLVVGRRAITSRRYA